MLLILFLFWSTSRILQTTKSDSDISNCSNLLSCSFYRADFFLPSLSFCVWLNDQHMLVSYWYRDTLASFYIILSANAIRHCSMNLFAHLPVEHIAIITMYMAFSDSDAASSFVSIFSLVSLIYLSYLNTIIMKWIFLYFFSLVSLFYVSFCWALDKQTHPLRVKWKLLWI